MSNNILPKSGHVIFTGHPSQYQGLIAKHYVNIASKAHKCPVYFKDVSEGAIPLDASHERVAIAQGIVEKDPRCIVVTACHYGTSAPLDVSDFEGVARIWEVKQHGQTLDVTLTEVWPKTGRTIYLQGVHSHSGIAWQEVGEPEPTPLGRQRLSTSDNGKGMPDAPDARTMIGEYLKANPTRKVIQL